MGKATPVTPAAQMYPVGVTGFLLLFASILTALFLTNLGTSEEADFYRQIGQFYSFMGIFSALLVFPTIIWSDPRKTSADIYAFFACFLPFFAIFVMSQGLTYQQTVLLALPMPILQLLIASAEEGFFRIAVPRIAYLAAGGREFRRWFFAGVVSTLLFALFHAWVYELAQAKLLSAALFGTLQYLTFRIAVLLSGDGATALAGIIGSHWLLNLYLLGEDWMLWGFYYVLFMLVLLVLARQYPLDFNLRKAPSGGPLGWK